MGMRLRWKRGSILSSNPDAQREGVVAPVSVSKLSVGGEIMPLKDPVQRKAYQKSYNAKYSEQFKSGTRLNLRNESVLIDNFDKNKSLLVNVDDMGNVIIPISLFLSTLIKYGVNYKEFVTQNKFGIEVQE
jgi:hypothetical protein